jgi:hypothetical protein
MGPEALSEVLEEIRSRPDHDMDEFLPKSMPITAIVGYNLQAIRRASELEQIRSAKPALQTSSPARPALTGTIMSPRPP